MRRLCTAVFLLFSTVPVCISSAQTPPARPAPQFVVTLSFNDAVLRTNQAQKALTALQAKFAPRQAQLQALDAEVEVLRKQMESESDKLSDTEKSNLILTLGKKQKQLERQAEDFKSDSQSESQEAFQRVAQKAFVFLQSFAAQHHYTAVIERGTEDSPVVWSATGLDITEDLYKAYNAQSGETAAQPQMTPSTRAGASSTSILPDGPSPHP